MIKCKSLSVDKKIDIKHFFPEPYTTEDQNGIIKYGWGCPYCGKSSDMSGHLHQIGSPKISGEVEVYERLVNEKDPDRYYRANHVDFSIDDAIFGFDFFATTNERVKLPTEKLSTEKPRIVSKTNNNIPTFVYTFLARCVVNSKQTRDSYIPNGEKNLSKEPIKHYRNIYILVARLLF